MPNPNAINKDIAPFLDFLLNKELENDNTSQWVDINTTTSYLKIDILSSYPGVEVSGSNPFDECAIQEITFYGRG